LPLSFPVQISYRIVSYRTYNRPHEQLYVGGTQSPQSSIRHQTNNSLPLTICIKAMSDDRQSWPILSANKKANKNMSSVMQNSSDFIVQHRTFFYSRR